MTPSKPYLSLDLARYIARETTAAAEKEHIRVIVAVVDEGGHLVVMERMDNAAYGSIDDAIFTARRAIAEQKQVTNGPWKRGRCIAAYGCAIGAVSVVSVEGAVGGQPGAPNIEQKLGELMQGLLSKIDAWLQQPVAA